MNFKTLIINWFKIIGAIGGILIVSIAGASLLSFALSLIGTGATLAALVFLVITFVLATIYTFVSP